jgi:hypothetical protein
VILQSGNPPLAVLVLRVAVRTVWFSPVASAQASPDGRSGRRDNHEPSGLESWGKAALALFIYNLTSTFGYSLYFFLSTNSQILYPLIRKASSSLCLAPQTATGHLTEAEAYLGLSHYQRSTTHLSSSIYIRIRLIMADASCSGGTPFKRLIDHQARDVSHHQDRLVDRAGPQGHAVSPRCHLIYITKLRSSSPSDLHRSRCKVQMVSAHS